MARICLLFAFLLSCFSPHPAEAQRYRIIVSTDIGGTDPDDNQLLVRQEAMQDWARRWAWLKQR
ncbi:MAG: hypothetical protein IJ200_01685 [Prevotella sp.]|nr:hypothetical protein [Prevotella sp.]